MSDVGHNTKSSSSHCGVSVWRYRWRCSIWQVQTSDGEEKRLVVDRLNRINTQEVFANAANLTRNRRLRRLQKQSSRAEVHLCRCKICLRSMLGGVTGSDSIATGFQACLKFRSPGLGGGDLSSTCCERAVRGGQTLFSLRRRFDSVQRLLLIFQKMTDLRSKLLTSGKSVLNAIIEI